MRQVCQHLHWSASQLLFIQHQWDRKKTSYDFFYFGCCQYFQKEIKLSFSLSLLHSSFSLSCPSRKLSFYLFLLYPRVAADFEVSDYYLFFWMLPFIAKRIKSMWHFQNNDRWKWWVVFKRRRLIFKNVTSVLFQSLSKIKQ